MANFARGFFLNLSLAKMVVRTVCYIIGVPLFQKSNILTCIDQIKAAAPHFKAMANTIFLSRAFIDRCHLIGAMAHFLRQLKNQKRVSSITVNEACQ